ncbi:MAG: DNA (cytosine-5-)-methyltransferase [Clostridium sp.]|nr:DNA (cytosine-5-)-methyltransferase [Clostridium sp.]MCM1171820.1 DNA (cytosine-5-)-methyltransferase [Clostridium sp.]MCM1207770.1 DNA (cytosine-5-)-methyltransferase [Ruminococcus sp.]
MNKQIKVVSLFSGIGGFEEGLKKAKIPSEIVFSSEIDGFAQKSYIANFSDKHLHGDIKAVNEKDVPDHDLLLAGFPCQSFSIAGRRKGFDDIRGTLFFDVARILAEKKPKYILLENVKNLISHDGSNTIRKILETLNEIGYTVDFTVINSCEAGVPQNRDRTYICGIFGGIHEKFITDTRNAKANMLKQELNESDFRGFNFFDKVTFDNKQKFIEDILEDDVEDAFFFDTESIRQFLNEYEEDELNQNEIRIIKLLDLPRDVHNDLERQRRVYSIKGISPTVLARSDSTKILIRVNGNLRIRKITPVENFYIQGFDKAFVDRIKAAEMSATQMYKQSGNAVSPPVITGILQFLNKEYMAND